MTRCDLARYRRDRYTRRRGLWRPGREHRSRVRCNGREKCEGNRRSRDETNELRTWRDATRLTAREELANRRAPTQTHPTAPFQPTRPTEPPLREQVPTLSLSLFHPRRRSQPSPYPRPTFRSVHRYLPPDLSQVRIDAVGVSSNTLGTCRTFYLRLSPGFVALASNFIARPTSRYEEQNDAIIYCKFPTLVVLFKFISIRKLFSSLCLFVFLVNCLLHRARYITIYWISYISY